MHYETRTIIGAAKFKEQCLALLDNLDTHELIAATSIVHRVPSLTRDKRIRKSALVPLA